MARGSERKSLHTLLVVSTETDAKVSAKMLAFDSFPPEQGWYIQELRVTELAPDAGGRYQEDRSPSGTFEQVVEELEIEGVAEQLAARLALIWALAPDGVYYGVVSRQNEEGEE